MTEQDRLPEDTESCCWRPVVFVFYRQYTR